MRNTPITDDLARQFAGKRLSSREAGSVWSLCRDLERELNKVITALAQSKEANAGLMRACDNLERELAEVTKQRDALADAFSPFVTLNPLSKRVQEKWHGYVLNAKQALAATKGGSHE
jgi:hypothetical protein